MSGKLDQSLDDILKSRARPAKGRRGNVRSRGTRVTRVTTRTPTGGVAKTTTKVTAPNGKAAKQVVVPAAAPGESKILVSGLPSDVSEQQIKDYFAKTIGPVKKVFLTYGPNGQSRGISTIVFTKSGSAHEAATQLNGVKVDNRAMKIEVIVGANQAPVPVPAKALGERILNRQTKGAANAKNQPKSAVTAATKKTATRGTTKGRRGRNAGRGKPKTAAELDAEMTDYFDPSGANASAATNGTAQPAAATGDAGMEDEIM